MAYPYDNWKRLSEPIPKRVFVRFLSRCFCRVGGGDDQLAWTIALMEKACTGSLKMEKRKSVDVGLEFDSNAREMLLTVLRNAVQAVESKRITNNAELGILAGHLEDIAVHLTDENGFDPLFDSGHFGEWIDRDLCKLLQHSDSYEFAWSEIVKEHRLPATGADRMAFDQLKGVLSPSSVKLIRQTLSNAIDLIDEGYLIGALEAGIVSAHLCSICEASDEDDAFRQGLHGDGRNLDFCEQLQKVPDNWSDIWKRVAPDHLLPPRTEDDDDGDESECDNENDLNESDEATSEQLVTTAQPS